MNLLTTDKTYATREDAIKALETGCKKIGATIDKNIGRECGCGATRENVDHAVWCFGGRF